MVDWEVIFVIFVRVNGFNFVIVVDKIFFFVLLDLIFVVLYCFFVRFLGGNWFINLFKVLSCLNLLVGFW